MERNLGGIEQVVRALAGVAAIGVGLVLGGLAWWAMVLYVVGALLLLSAATGFCHVKKKLGIGRTGAGR